MPAGAVESRPGRRDSHELNAILISMSLARTLVGGLILLLIIVPTVRLAPSAADHVSHHSSMKSSRAPSGVGRTTVATPSAAALPPILTPRGLDAPAGSDRLVSIDPAVPFVPPRG